MRAPVKQVTAQGFTASCGAVVDAQPPTEKCAEKARANEPKPPRVTLPDPESGEPADDAWFDPVSLLKKLERDDHYPPWPPPTTIRAAAVGSPVAAPPAPPCRAMSARSCSRGISA